MKKSIVEKFSFVLCFIEKGITSFFFVIMLSLIILQVVSRYYLHWPLAWTEESIRYMFIVASFLGAAAAVGSREHIEINILPSILKAAKMKIKAQEIFLGVTDSLIYIVGVLFWAFITSQMYGYMLNVKSMNQVSIAMQLSLWILVLVIVISGGLCCLHYFLNLVIQMQKFFGKGEQVNG